MNQQPNEDRLRDIMQQLADEIGVDRVHAFSLPEDNGSETRMAVVSNEPGNVQQSCEALAAALLSACSVVAMNGDNHPLGVLASVIGDEAAEFQKRAFARAAQEGDNVSYEFFEAMAILATLGVKASDDGFDPMQARWDRLHAGIEDPVSVVNAALSKAKDG